MREIAVVILFLFVFPTLICIIACSPFFWGDIQMWRARRERRRMQKKYGDKVIPLPQKGRRLGR